jgi:hypothetical protein
MTACLLPPAPGSATLSCVGLLDLPLTCEQGWSLEQLQIGFPAVRPVVRSRALDDGVFDDTLFVGARAVTVTLRMATATATQAAIDAIMPFMSPRQRPTLTWALAGSPGNLRSLTLRGVDAPVVIDGPSYQRIVCSWVSTESYLRGGDEHCVAAVAQATEGRTYDLTFDRVYSSVSPSVSFIVNNAGTAPARWRAVINATATDPTLTINGVPMTFNQNGGVNLVGFDQLFISTAERSVLITPFPLSSAYDRVNFFDWRWDELLLQPGDNLITFTVSAGNNSLLEFCWYDSWL